MYQLISKYRGQIMGVASIMVVLLHFVSELYPDFYIPGITLIISRGNIGVDVFLLVSGMGLWFSMSKNADPIAFWKKRVQRVLLPTLEITLLYWIWVDLLSSSRSIGLFLLDWTGLSFWINGTTTIWYVSLILILYLLYPLFYRIQCKNNIYSALIILLTIAAAGIMFGVLPDVYDKYEIALTRVPIFLIGSLLGEFLQKKEKAPVHTKLLLNGYIILSFIAFVGCFILMNRMHSLSIMLYRYGSGAAAFLICFAVGAIFKKFTLKFISDVCKYLGEVSLELYLIHIMIRNIIANTALGNVESTFYRVVIIISFIIVSLLVTFGVCEIKKKITAHFNRG